MTEEQINDKISQILSVKDPLRWNFREPIPYDTNYQVVDYCNNKTGSVDILNYCDAMGFDYEVDNIITDRTNQGWQFGFFTVTCKDIAIAFLKFMDMYTEKDG